MKEELLDNVSTTKKYNSGTYYGEIKDDKRDGYGEMIYNDGKKYEGQWKNDRINGQGKIFKNYKENIYHSSTFIQTGDDGKIYNNIVTPMEETTYILPIN